MSDSTIGDDPLDSVIPKQEKSTNGSVESPTGRSKDGDSTKKRMTIHLPEPLTERIKNAVYWTPGLTISELATRALSEVMDNLEEEQNDGTPFPDRDKELKGGRPMK